MNLPPKPEKCSEIPDDHYTGLIVGFGYPEIKYVRGVQKKTKLKNAPLF